MNHYLPHQHLPPPFDRYASLLLLEDVVYADTYLLAAVGLLTCLAFIQLRLFARPPPVPLKRLPVRPSLSILFKPDDMSSTSKQQDEEQLSANNSLSPKLRTISSSFLMQTTASMASDQTETSILDAVKEVIRMGEPSTPTRSQHLSFRASSGLSASDQASVGNLGIDQADRVEGTTASSKIAGTHHSTSSQDKSFCHSRDLPDSFAPLLSSSQTELLLHQLTVDLIHGIQVEAGITMRQGEHEIPLNKDTSRPQLILDVPEGGCELSVAAGVGSDRLTDAQDLDVSIPTASRSCPMVKNAGITFEPPLPLLNVAPTLIHFPTLFEDNLVPSLRRMQLFRFAMDSIISISSFLEKLLWVIERIFKIHLSRIRIAPLYKGRSSVDDISPEWRLSLSFSGHLLFCGLVPIPFINFILPTFVIPQPHAMLEYLLTNQPLASARLKRENIAENKIALALIETASVWNSNIRVVATPPGVGVDLTLSGGVSLGLELMHGRDANAGRNRQDIGDISTQNVEIHTRKGAASVPAGSVNSLSSWTSYHESATNLQTRFSSSRALGPTFDANDLVPWSLEISAKGSISSEKMTFHLINCSLEHDDRDSPIAAKSQILTLGSLAVWKGAVKADTKAHSSIARRQTAFAHRAALAGTNETASVASILLFANDTDSYRREARMLHYDYAFDVREESKVDSITFSVGASHPMLNGGSMVTTILESIYARGSISARQDAVMDPSETRRKRNILRHLPAIDFEFGIQNAFIPSESYSYTDDGQTRSLPEMDGGRVMVRFVGGIDEARGDPISTYPTNEVNTDDRPVAEGIKVIGDFGFSSITLNSETWIKEFPELDIFEGAKLRSLSSGKLEGTVMCYLRPQRLASKISTTGPNIFNPLEAYEIDFSGSSLFIKIKESSTSLGHRRVIIPTETTVMIKVVESIVDMSLEGKTQCELSWDFQGLSPILQVTEVGQSPENVMHENKEQVSLLIAPLRQGRLNFHVSPVGGINITKAVTSREDKEGLYDWKFFNALVSPDQKSAERLLQVIDDKRTMYKLLQVIKLVNADAHRILRYLLTHFWRAKEILDQEGVLDPKHVIPAHKTARLMSLFICGDLSQVDVFITLVRRVVAGDGLDVVKLKEVLRQHLEGYDDWAPEIDRGVRWLETMFSPIAVPQPYVENHVAPLSELEHHAARFRKIPSASKLYEHINDQPHLPLDVSFSNLVNRVAPYLSFRQIEYFLKVRSSNDWQPSDLKRLRYVYSVKRKVLDIAESYGGLSFLPQSFLVSVFLGEATRASLRAPQQTTIHNGGKWNSRLPHINISSKPSTLISLRHRRARLQDPFLREMHEEGADGVSLTPAGRVASMTNFLSVDNRSQAPSKFTMNTEPTDGPSQYELGDCLLGPEDVAILLQAGLTSVMKGSSVVQLNQRMLLDLVASQPKSFAVAVLAEIGTPGGQGSPRGLTSALMALLELDQNSFRPVHRLDMHALLESWLPGLKVPRREDYMAGGRWARQSYYEAIFSLAQSILEDAECYMALKGHIQRCRLHKESDPIPHPREDVSVDPPHGEAEGARFHRNVGQSSKLKEGILLAKASIEDADKHGASVLQALLSNEEDAKLSEEYSEAIKKYRDAFDACARVRGLDKLAFHSPWFKEFYRRNYDALMIKSVLDNVVEDVDRVRYWLHAMRRGAKYGPPRHGDSNAPSDVEEAKSGKQDDDDIFLDPKRHSEQALIDAIIDSMIYLDKDREHLRQDPLVRLLIPNPPGEYSFTVVTAMGVITEGKAGLELQPALDRLKEKRGVETIRADTATARSFEFNAGRIVEAIEAARDLQCPYGLIGYSQGCANALMAESLLLSGTPLQRQEVSDRKTGLVCRQLLFSAANGSRHGPASDKKVQRLIVMWEEFFKYQQGYFSRALQSTFLEILNSAMDSAPFQKMMGGAQSMLHDGCRVFWRESQHLAHVPTCTLRGVLEDHTTPECLEMLSNMLTKQSGSALHDSQVHVYDAVGHPVYHSNRNGRVLEKCESGRGAIQRTHHWSPLNEEVKFLATQRDEEMASFDCAKDRHVFPWVDVNVRFGFINYKKQEQSKEKLRD